MQKMQTRDNIRDMLCMVNSMTLRQIIRFFSSETRPEIISRILRDMVERREILYDRIPGKYSCLGSPIYEPKLEKRRELAVEAISSLGSNSVYAVYALDYPNLFEVCTDNSGTYDYAVIENVTEAITAARYRANGIPLGVEDDTVHFAILTREEKLKTLSKDLLHTGFDYVILIDPKTYEISYHTLKNDNG